MKPEVHEALTRIHDDRKHWLLAELRIECQTISREEAEQAVEEFLLVPTPSAKTLLTKLIEIRQWTKMRQLAGDWWMEFPDRGGLDLEAIDALIAAPPAETLSAQSEAEFMRQKAISNARERNAAERAVQAALDDFELIVERIDAGQIDRARGTAFQGAKEARRFLSATAAEETQ